MSHGCLKICCNELVSLRFKNNPISNYIDLSFKTPSNNWETIKRVDHEVESDYIYGERGTYTRETFLDYLQSIVGVDGFVHYEYVHGTECIFNSDWIKQFYKNPQPLIFAQNDIETGSSIWHIFDAEYLKDMFDQHIIFIGDICA